VSERFLVTGSEGCIGAWTVRHLVRQGHAVVAMDQSPAGMRLHKVLEPEGWSKVDHVQVDLRDKDGVADLIKDRGITRIVHLAALQVPFVAANPLLGAEVNVVGTVRVLEAARAVGDQVRGISYASSAAAIGPVESPHEPSTLYGAFKLANEHTARIYARDYATASVGLRPCVVYGAARDQGLTAALTHAIKAAVLGVPYQIPFSGLIDLQYAADVAQAFAQSALLDGNTGAPVYDLHGDGVTVSGYIETLERVYPAASGLITAADAVMPGNVDVDDTDLIARIGDLTKTSLADGIAESVERFTAHRDQGLLTVDELPKPAA
jgi:nucleoside-diphosphate-sugar epimerase